MNRIPHPGEKRLIALAEKLCPRLPEAMRADVEALLQAAGQGDQRLLVQLHRLADHLDGFLDAQGFARSSR